MTASLVICRQGEQVRAESPVKARGSYQMNIRQTPQSIELHEICLAKGLPFDSVVATSHLQSLCELIRRHSMSRRKVKLGMTMVKMERETGNYLPEGFQTSLCVKQPFLLIDGKLKILTYLACTLLLFYVD
eukprot:scaffold310_cov174-Ochromonas_danica.AAC.7